MSGREVCAYFNTSVLIKAVNPREPGHREVLGLINCLKRNGIVLVYSNIHWRERFRSGTREMVRSLFRREGFVRCVVDVDAVFEWARRWVRSHGYSDERINDVAHMRAARLCGCRFIVAVDRFMWNNARRFGLIYINYHNVSDYVRC